MMWRHYEVVCYFLPITVHLVDVRRCGRGAHLLGQGLDPPLLLQARQLPDRPQRPRQWRVRGLRRGELWGHHQIGAVSY